MKIVIIFLIGSFLLYLTITQLVDTVLLGTLVRKISNKGIVPSYMVEGQNRIDIQTGFQCSAFASAYVLRHFGIAADGKSLYVAMPHKMKSGYVYPKGIRALLQRYGIGVQYCRGNLATLKQELQKGHPVIVMIRVRKDKDWLHYVPIVGYDEEYLYVAESLPELVNSQGTSYNRKITKAEFLQLWNTAMLKQPLYKNTYFAYTGENQSLTFKEVHHGRII